MDLLQSLLALMTPIGLALFALLITREGQKDRAAENARRDAREDFERERQAKAEERSILLFATLSGKQETTAAAIIKSGVDSEARVATQVSTSEATVKSRVDTVGAANIVRLDKIDKALEIILTTVNLYTDPSADARYDKALAILTAKLEDMAADIKEIHADVATNTEIGTANTAAITDAATALAASTSPAPPDAPAPAEVVVADISPQAVASIMDAVTPKAAAGENLEDVA